VPEALNGWAAHPVPPGEAMPRLDSNLLATDSALVQRCCSVDVGRFRDAEEGGEGGTACRLQCDAAGQKDDGAGLRQLGQLLWRLGKMYCSELPAPLPALGDGLCSHIRDAHDVPPAGAAADSAGPPHRFSLYDAFAEDPDAWRKVRWSRADAAALQAAASAAAASMVRAVALKGEAGRWHSLAAPAWCASRGRKGDAGDDDAGLIVHVELELCFGRRWGPEAEGTRCEWVGSLDSSGGEATPESDLVDVQVVGVALAAT
jgi:hypothetical protein